MADGLTPIEQKYFDQNSSKWQLVFGSMLIGGIVDALLLGIILCLFLYWKLRLERDESWPYKALVYWITLGSIAHSAWVQAFSWSVFVTGYGDYIQPMRGFWIKGDYIFQLLLVMPIEVMYGVRAYILWGRPKALKFGLPIWFAANVALGIASIVMGPSDPIGATTSPYFVSWAVVLLILDWFLTGTIVVGLIRKRSGLPHSDKLILRLVIFSAESQLVPSLVTLGMVIKILVWPDSMIILSLMFISKLWTVTALVVIDYRNFVRGEIEEERLRRETDIDVGPTNLNDAEAGAESSGRGSGSTSEKVVEEMTSRRRTVSALDAELHTGLGVVILPRNGDDEGLGYAPLSSKSPSASRKESGASQISFRDMLYRGP